MSVSQSLALDPNALSPRAREAFEKRFLPRFAALEKDKARETLTILVWGSGPADKEMFAKRMQIRDALRALEHAAFFSEELRAIKSPDESEKTFEYKQAKAADAILVLMASFGAVAEAHDFADDRDIAARMQIYVPASAAGGYSDQGALADLRALFRNVEMFQPEEIASCQLKTRALDYIAHLQATKWMAKKKAESWG